MLNTCCLLCYLPICHLHRLKQPQSTSINLTSIKNWPIPIKCTYLDGSEGVCVRIQVVRQPCRMVIDQDVIIGDARRTSHVAATLVVGLTRQEILHLPLVPAEEKSGGFSIWRLNQLARLVACCVFQEVCYDSDLTIMRVGRRSGWMINGIS